MMDLGILVGTVTKFKSSKYPMFMAVVVYAIIHITINVLSIVHLYFSIFTDMAPSIKVTYFNIRGLAETIRLLLKYGEIEFEDNRIQSEEWAALKATTPFGQMPLYEEDGKVAWQSLAICRYLAKKVNLRGANDWEDLQVDAIADTITDLRIKIASLMQEKDEEKKEQLKQTLIKETAPYYLERLDKIAGENGGHFLTWVDFYFFAMSHIVNFLLGADGYANYKNLQAVVDNVQKIPAIKKWVEVRPKTDF
ncbi:glutathione s-transferase [Holotrichia oblita]|uniref:Glutathione s-transferase n=1 Tax=Holotrichia oblita TaxID=644536 RepID=A0ACB9TVA7_HOLOL|nr:glutathione s-transferase [Holotrichia oblita]